MLHLTLENLGQEARQLLKAPIAQTFYSSLTFWDKKRPIKSSISNCLNLPQLERQSFNVVD